MIDNTTAVYTLNNVDTIRSYLCNSVVKKIWAWAIKREIWLSSTDIPGKFNEDADALSREEQIMSERMLSKDIFAAAMKKLDMTPNIDLFASRINCQLIPYVSYGPDPESCAADPFSIGWCQCVYALPPFSVLVMMLQKIDGWSNKCMRCAELANTTLVYKTNENGGKSTSDGKTFKNTAPSPKFSRRGTPSSQKVGPYDLSYPGKLN